MNNLIKKIASGYRKACLSSYAFAKKNASGITFVFGVVLLLSGMESLAYAQNGNGYATPAYDDTAVRSAVDGLFCLIEGAFGALIMVVAGLGAIVAAAMGAYRAAVGMLVVAVGAFILRALVTLFFGDFAGDYSCSPGGGA